MCIEIRKGIHEYIDIIAELAIALWPDHTVDGFIEEFSELLQNPYAVVYLAFSRGMPVGFAQCQIRRDYVEGTSGSPVGYLEGIFVREESRMQGVAKRLLYACECWAKEMGCKEFASDCELTNMESMRFHLNVGFTEVNRVISFTKQI